MIGRDLEKVRIAAKKVLAGEIKKGEKPELWDGKAAERIARIIVDTLQES